MHNPYRNNAREIDTTLDEAEEPWFPKHFEIVRVFVEGRLQYGWIRDILASVYLVQFGQSSHPSSKLVFLDELIRVPKKRKAVP